MTAGSSPTRGGRLTTPHAGSPCLLQPWARRTGGVARWGHLRHEKSARRAGATRRPHGRRAALWRHGRAQAVGSAWPRSAVPQARACRCPAVVLPWSWRNAHLVAGHPHVLAEHPPASDGASHRGATPSQGLQNLLAWEGTSLVWCGLPHPWCPTLGVRRG